MHWVVKLWGKACEEKHMLTLIQMYTKGVSDSDTLKIKALSEIRHLTKNNKHNSTAQQKKKANVRLNWQTFNIHTLIHILHVT